MFVVMTLLMFVVMTLLMFVVMTLLVRSIIYTFFTHAFQIYWDKKTHGLHFALLTTQIFGFPTFTFTNGVSCKSISTKDGSHGSISGCGGQGGIVPPQIGGGGSGGAGGDGGGEGTSGGGGSCGTFPLFPLF